MTAPADGDGLARLGHALAQSTRQKARQSPVRGIATATFQAGSAASTDSVSPAR